MSMILQKQKKMLYHIQGETSFNGFSRRSVWGWGIIFLYFCIIKTCMNLICFNW